MYRIKKEEGFEVMPLPCEYFDLIGGTSTGGYVIDSNTFWARFSTSHFCAAA